MIALIQRVSQAEVRVSHHLVGQIKVGLLVFVGVEQGDDREKAAQLAKKVVSYRVFSDEAGKMNLNVQQAGGELLVVSQFTLAADTRKGLRPSFSCAATPALARALYDDFLGCCRQYPITIQTGQFAADMQVSLTNDGPVTFWLSV